MNTVIILLGANLGNEQEIFSLVTTNISNKIGQCILSSSIYVSPPWGFEHTNNFYNQVLLCNTLLDAHRILEICLQIEKELGRVRTQEQGYAARTIDIDLLFYNDEVISTSDLTIPHPLLHERRFTLAPLSEIVPEFKHPLLRKTCKELLEECTDKSEVKIL